MWFMERDEGTDSRVYIVIYSELCGIWSELKVQRAWYIDIYIHRDLCGLRRELMVQRTGRIVLYTVNCVFYGLS